MLAVFFQSYLVYIFRAKSILFLLLCFFQLSHFPYFLIISFFCAFSIRWIASSHLECFIMQWYGWVSSKLVLRVLFWKKLTIRWISSSHLECFIVQALDGHLPEWCITWIFPNDNSHVYLCPFVCFLLFSCGRGLRLQPFPPLLLHHKQVLKSKCSQTYI